MKEAVINQAISYINSKIDMISCPHHRKWYNKKLIKILSNKDVIHEDIILDQLFEFYKRIYYNSPCWCNIIWPYRLPYCVEYPRIRRPNLPIFYS